jgi:hypothetical protein
MPLSSGCRGHSRSQGASGGASPGRTGSPAPLRGGRDQPVAIYEDHACLAHLILSNTVADSRPEPSSTNVILALWPARSTQVIPSQQVQDQITRFMVRATTGARPQACAAAQARSSNLQRVTVVQGRGSRRARRRAGPPVCRMGPVQVQFPAEVEQLFQRVRTTIQGRATHPGCTPGRSGGGRCSRARATGTWEQRPDRRHSSSMISGGGGEDTDDDVPSQASSAPAGQRRTVG